MTVLDSSGDFDAWNRIVWLEICEGGAVDADASAEASICVSPQQAVSM